MTERERIVEQIKQKGGWYDEKTVEAIADWHLAEVKRIVEALVKAKDYLYGVLCDPEGYVCIQGSDRDKEYAQKGLTLIDETLKRAGL